MGWGGFLDQLLRKLPIQDRRERIRNQIDAYEKEKNNLLKKAPSMARSRRMAHVINELNRLRGLLKNLR